MQWDIPELPLTELVAMEEDLRGAIRERPGTYVCQPVQMVPDPLPEGSVLVLGGYKWVPKEEDAVGGVYSFMVNSLSVWAGNIHWTYAMSVTLVDPRGVVRDAYGAAMDDPESLVREALKKIKEFLETYELERLAIR